MERKQSDCQIERGVDFNVETRLKRKSFALYPDE